MHPPHRPKRNESGRKISLNFVEDLFFFLNFFLETTWFWAKKKFELPISAEKSVSILVKTFFFFFFFFGDHLILGEKNVWPPDFGRKKRLNFRFRPKNQSQFWWRHPNIWGFGFKSPPPKFSGSATGRSPNYFQHFVNLEPEPDPKSPARLTNLYLTVLMFLFIATVFISVFQTQVFFFNNVISYH